MNTYYGIKTGMTQTWDKAGKRFPVSIIRTDDVTVTQVKNADVDGYAAAQVGFGTKKKHSKALQQHLKKSQAAPRYIREVQMGDMEVKLGDTISSGQVLSVGDVVTVRGVSKGRGFAGVIKRWGFAGGPRTHGQSDRRRAPGSIGQGTDPGRVHKGKKMPGRFGNQQFAIRSLKVLKVDEENNEVWVGGPIPGAVGSVVTLTKTGEFDFDGLFHEEERESVVSSPRQEAGRQESGESVEEKKSDGGEEQVRADAITDDKEKDEVKEEKAAAAAEDTSEKKADDKAEKKEEKAKEAKDTKKSDESSDDAKKEDK